MWLATGGLGERLTADAAMLDPTLQAREALREAVDGDPSRGAALVDAVLEHGRIRPALTAGGPGERAESGDPAWGPAWLAARDYLRLPATAPDRIRRRAHAERVLHFFKTSRNGTRRRCSMAVRGNRAKASRHYARSRG
ncbi:CGNR zinc finger domain-containing protein [Streptomyces sp. NPDC046831]|uniref:CGNR zinc finger domain-containing protein n=1 Tax=Streptomyces sp. NPDC046831 TaxID=3154805 RepID=UPI0034038B4B